jgi:hypothetical protein
LKSSSGICDVPITPLLTEMTRIRGKYPALMWLCAALLPNSTGC